jgi:glycosyltransferase involved in cell wall biosynthesis
VAREPIAGSPFNDPRLWIVGTVGRLAAVKDQSTLIHAFARMVEARGALGDHLRLAIIGAGPQRGDLERAVQRRGLGGRVWFAGDRNDIDAVLRGLDCFALSSVAEGISNTVLEAMASGLPIVATDVGGNRELIEDGVSGRLVAAADAGALAAAIGGIADDVEMARRLGDAARRAAVARFSLDRMVDEYAALYDRCLAQRAPVALSAASF